MDATGWSAGCWEEKGESEGWRTTKRKIRQQTSPANVILAGPFRPILLVAFPNFLFPSRRRVA
jgi:hypothetical protein